jgi:hypothetical protein
LINNGDFAFERIVIASIKKRKMDIEDEFIPNRDNELRNEKEM